MSQRERSKLMQKEILGIAAICVCIFAFFVVVAMPPVSAAARSSIVITDVFPTTLHHGDTRVILTVKNNGAGDARDVRLVFQAEDNKNVSLIGSTEVPIPALNAGREKKVTITVQVDEGIPNGVYAIPVKYSWNEYYFHPERGYFITIPNNFFYHPDVGGFHGNPVTSDIAFTVRGSPILTLVDVHTEPEYIRPGSKGVKIAMTITNTGEATAKEVEAKLACNDGMTPSKSGATHVYVGGINAGKAISAPFYVNIAADVAAGVYNLPLVITYKDTGNREYVLNKSMELVVEGKPELDIYSYYTDPTNLSAGDSAVLHVSVRNVGSEQAESVSVRVTEAADTPFNFSTKSDYVGNLKVNAAGNAVMKFTVDANATNNVYPQGLDLICRGDPGSGNYTFNDKIQLEVFSVMSNTSNLSVTPEAPSPTALGFDASLAFIALFVISVFLLCRKRGK
jgi:hypothetical protein